MANSIGPNFLLWDTAFVYVEPKVSPSSVASVDASLDNPYRKIIVTQIKVDCPSTAAGGETIITMGGPGGANVFKQIVYPDDHLVLGYHGQPMDGLELDTVGTGVVVTVIHK